MLRVARLALVFSLASAACDRDPEQPRGGAWQPCGEDNQCSDESLSCLQAWGASDVTACLPKCATGETCAAAPVSETGLAAAPRCTATDTSPGRCVVDCSTGNDCPTGLLCFFDNAHTPSTGRGICAWPPL